MQYSNENDRLFMKLSIGHQKKMTKSDEVDAACKESTVISLTEKRKIKGRSMKGSLGRTTKSPNEP